MGDVKRICYYVNGEFKESKSGEYRDAFDPSTGKVIAKVPCCTKEEVEEAIASAKAAFPAWSSTPVLKRVQILYRLRDLLIEHMDELTHLVALENGKAWEEGVNVGKLLAAIPKDKPVWVLCHTGNKSLYVAELLSDAGFDAGSVEGGYRSFLRLSLSMMVMNEEEVTERTKAIERSIITKYRKSIWRRFTKGVHDYELIKEGDKIAVCISGGKDSMLMAKLLQELQLHGKVKFDLVFLVMNPGYNEDNWNIILNNAKLLGIPINVFESDIFNIVADVDKSPCYLCARMRRGYLYSHAKELGCNKIALGHHFNDVIETTVMSMFYGSQMQAMLPKLHSTNFAGMELIRPLYCIHEEDILAWKQYNDLEFIQCACRFTENCTMCDNGGGGSKRQEVKILLRRLRRDNPNIERSIFNSIHAVNLDMMPGYKSGGVLHSFLDDYNERGKKSE